MSVDEAENVEECLCEVLMQTEEEVGSDDDDEVDDSILDQKFFDKAYRKQQKYDVAILPDMLKKFSLLKTREQFSAFLMSFVPSGFKVYPGAVDRAFDVSSCVVKVVTETIDANGAKRHYPGTGTVFNFDGDGKKKLPKRILFTNKHCTTAQGNGPNETFVKIVAKFHLSTDIDITSCPIKNHPSYLDVVKIDVTSLSDAFPNVFPHYAGVMVAFRFDNLLTTLPQVGDTDFGYLMFVVGYPLGLTKRVSAAVILKSVEKQNGFCFHSVPTFVGNSGSLLFAVPIKRGGKFHCDLINPDSNCIAGIHYRRTFPDPHRNGFISLEDMVAINHHK